MKGRGRIKGALAALAAMVALASAATSANAATVGVQNVGELQDMTSLVSSPAEPNLLYVTLVDGEIFSIEEGAIEPVVDLSSLVQPKSPTGEQALNSMVLAPDFATTRRFYVDYVSSARPGENIVVAELIDKGTPEQIFASRRTVLEIFHPETTHHYSGDLQFGPEGDLFISTGDSYPEEANYPDHSPAQELASPLGKILRIDPTPDGAQLYAVPADNPYVSTPGASPLIWSRGMRNPFRFSIDKATSNIIIGDVGEETWEELNFGAGGGPAGPVGGKSANYGWPCYEGSEATTPKPLPACENEEPPFTDPMLAYHHQAGPPTLCSVIAGYVVHDPTVAALDDRFVYGDFCSGQISSTVPGTTATGTRVETEINTSLLAQEEARSGEVGEGVVSFKLQAFGEDGCGRDYILMGAVYRITGETTASCTGLGLAVAGQGTVSGPGVSCPGTCARSFLNEALATVPLTATPAPGWHFAGWEGDCTGTGACAPQMNVDRAVTAVFAPDPTPPPAGGGGTPTQPSPPPTTLPLPSNQVKIGGFKLNKSNGTGTLTVTPAGNGQVKLTGPGIVTVKRSAAGKKLSLPVKPTGKTKKTLRQKGRYSVKLTVAFTPKGGKTGKATKKVTLQLK